MELAVRQGADRFVIPGAYRALEARLRRRTLELADIPALVIAAFDRRTRMLPFLFYDSFLFPPGAVAIAGAMHSAGFTRTRAVFQLWNRNLRPSRAAIDGRRVQMLLVSSLQIHSRCARELIRDAWTAGRDRPLIITGGPKATYEPYDFWSTSSAGQSAAPDVAVTGEAYVLLDLLRLLVEYRGRHESLRTAFERARREGALDSIPGLVYLAPGADLRAPVVIDTGLQRLVPQLDEFAREATGLGLLERPHRRTSLSAAPLASSRVLRHFFNRRETAEAVFATLARSTACGRPFAERVRLGTEATEVDTYRNRDLLPLGKAAGLRALWFGIEDLTATLVNKGQKAEITRELFQVMRELKIAPMAMLMFHSGQPFSTPGALYGLRNQIDFLRKAGAVTVQCTAHTPVVGTREYERTLLSGRVIARAGRHAISEADIDGNHVVVVDGEAPWKRQLKLLGGYAAFYNPRNLLRALRDRSPLRRYYMGYQAAGILATVWTAARLAPYVLRLMTRRLERHAAPPLETVCVQYAPGAFPRLASTIMTPRQNDGSQRPTGTAC